MTLAFVALVLALQTGTVTTEAVIMAVPDQGKPFTIQLDLDDPVPHVLECMKKVHAMGGGVCQVPPFTFSRGKQRDFMPPKEVKVDVKIVITPPK